MFTLHQVHVLTVNETEDRRRRDDRKVRQQDGGTTKDLDLLICEFLAHSHLGVLPARPRARLEDPICYRPRLVSMGLFVRGRYWIVDR